MFIAMEESKTIELENSNNLLYSYEKSTENNDGIVKNDLKTQMDHIKEKLEKRSNIINQNKKLII